ncbi:hypothetical protein IKX12_01395 [Candidatus Saccharibacteria bacterium]|nr:hypothetical protein [Candidatus Saccharibacteria bacterium]
MSNKELSNHYTETTEDSEWGNLAAELAEDMQEAAELSEQEADEIEQDRIENNDLANLPDAEYYREHEDEINDLVRNIIQLRGESSVKKGEWNQEQRTHLDKNGLPTDYAHLVRYAKENPDSLETLTTEYKNLKKKEVEALTQADYNAKTNEGSTAGERWQEQWDENLKKYFGDDQTAIEIANESPIQDGENVNDFVARVWKLAIMRDNAEKIGGPAPDEARDEYGKRVNYLAQFDVDKPIWGQMDDEQKKDLRKRYPRNQNESYDAWRARVEKNLRVKVWEDTPGAGSNDSGNGPKGPEAPTTSGPVSDGPENNPTDPTDPTDPGDPDNPTDPTDPTDPAGPDGGKSTANTKATDDAQPAAAAAPSRGFPRPVAFANNRYEGKWYDQGRDARRDTAAKGQAEAIKAAAEKNIKNFDKAIEWYNNELTDFDRIIFASGHADLLGAEDDKTFMEECVKPLIEAGFPVENPPLTQEQLLKRFPENAEQIRNAFMTSEEFEAAHKNDGKAEKRIPYGEMSEAAKATDEKLRQIYGERWKCTIDLEKADAEVEELQAQIDTLNSKRFAFGKASKIKKLEARIADIKAGMDARVKQYTELEDKFKSEYSAASLTDGEVANIKDSEAKMAASCGRGAGSDFRAELANAQKQVDTWTKGYESFKSKGDKAGMARATEIIAAAQRDVKHHEKVLELQERYGFGSIIGAAESEGQAEGEKTYEQQVADYQNAIGAANNYRNETKEKSEAMPEDKRSDYVDSRLEGFTKLLMKIGEASKPISLAAAEKCTTPELAAEWSELVSKADATESFRLIRNVTEMIPGITSGNAAAAKRTYEKIYRQEDRVKAEEYLMKYFGAGIDFIAQLRGNSGEEQSDAA